MLRAAGVAQAGDEAGAQQGGLSAAGGAEDCGEAPVGDECEEFGRQFLAAEEAVVVAGFEAGEAAVGRLLRVGAAGGVADAGPLLGLPGPGGPPAALPLGRVAAARGDVGEGGGQGGQPFAGGGLGERRDGVPTAGGELPVGGPAGFLPELAQLVRELLDGSFGRVDRSFSAPHVPTPSTRHVTGLFGLVGQGCRTTGAGLESGLSWRISAATTRYVRRHTGEAR
ncbi:hypothetical protein TPA0909_53550 [Streptomyces albus]|nr:hypothetical protein TPA0909_02470 [Streptomyces albus]GHJ23741.1 hypothetical protein TPA0909_53550 [Streptomyces albus]